MSTLLIILGVIVALALALVRALALDEIRGRIQRRVKADVEETIASLPAELQAEWAEEWRAELASLGSMPLSAIAFARGLRRTAGQLVLSPEPVPARGRGLLRPAGVWAWLQALMGRAAPARTREILAWIVLAILSLVTGALGVLTILTVPLKIIIGLAVLLVPMLARIWMRR